MDRKLKHELMEKTASSLQQPLSVVEDVMGWMFRDVLKALKIHTEVEISGWGTMLMSPAKLRRRIEKLERIKGRLLAKPETEDILMKLEGTNNSLNYYYTRLNGMEKGLGGVEEFVDSPSENEGAYIGDSKEQTGNMSELP